MYDLQILSLILRIISSLSCYWSVKHKNPVYLFFFACASVPQIPLPWIQSYERVAPHVFFLVLTFMPFIHFILIFVYGVRYQFICSTAVDIHMSARQNRRTHSFPIRLSWLFYPEIQIDYTKHSPISIYIDCSDLFKKSMTLICHLLIWSLM